ncbi:MAG: S41 family peptidase [Anaerolineae bacterium]
MHKSTRVQNESSLSAWAKAHPGQATGRALFVLLHLILNSGLAGFILWGPLNLALTPAAVLGTLIGGGSAVLWARQQLALIQGDKTLARRRRTPLLSAPLIALTLGLTAVGQLYHLGAIAPLAREPEKGFERLWKLMDRHYVYFEQKHIDWNAVYERTRPRVAEAESETAYFRVIAQMLDEIPDGHTGLLEPDVTFADLRFFGYAGEYEGAAAVVAVGPEAERAGIEKGARLLALEGQPIEARMERWAEIIPPSSTPQHFRKRLFLHLMATFEETLEVTFETSDGAQRTVTLTWDPALHQDGRGETQPAITGERLDSGVGILRIRQFHGSGLVQAFDTALDGMMDAPGIIIDVRNNGGGNSVLADRIAGRFFTHPFTYGHEYYRSRIPQHLWRRFMPYQVRPRDDVYTGPVAVLTNPFTFSSAETFVVAMADSGRALIVGRPTAGATGNPIIVRLPYHGKARFSTGDFRRNDGTPLEGQGLHPDLEVVWTLEDLREGRDPDIAAAEAYLLNRRE